MALLASTSLADENPSADEVLLRGTGAACPHITHMIENKGMVVARSLMQPNKKKPLQCKT